MVVFFEINFYCTYQAIIYIKDIMRISRRDIYLLFTFLFDCDAKRKVNRKEKHAKVLYRLTAA